MSQRAGSQTRCDGLQVSPLWCGLSLSAVEAAGGGGLQLFVDSNMEVDSAVIRQLVNEVLTETVAQMLGQRDTLNTGPEPVLEPPKPGPAAAQEVEKLRTQKNFFSLCLCSDLKLVPASVPGKTGSAGSYTSTDPSIQSNPIWQRGYAPGHTSSLWTNQPAEWGVPSANHSPRWDPASGTGTKMLQVEPDDCFSVCDLRACSHAHLQPRARPLCW